MNKELKVKKDKVKVTKEEIEHEIGHILDRYAELVSKDGSKLYREGKKELSCIISSLNYIKGGTKL